MAYLIPFTWSEPVLSDILVRESGSQKLRI